MLLVFLVCLTGMVLAAGLHVASLQYEWFDNRFGKESGRRTGELVGLVGGWLFFGFWVVLWMLPQDRFTLPFTEGQLVIPVLAAESSFPHSIIGAAFLVPGAYLGLLGVRGTGIRTAERNRPSRLAVDGIYSKLRHPQYLGGLLSHLGMTFILAAQWSLAVTPAILVILYAMCVAEEQSLAEQFGEEYEEYRRRVPFVLFRLRVGKSPAHEDP